MKISKYFLLLCLSVLFVFPLTISAETVQNPFADYTKRVGVSEGSLLYFNTVLSGDTYLFISNAKAADGKISHLWNIYKQTETAYIHSDRVVSLSGDVLALTTVRDIPGKVLVTYFPASSETGSLKALEIKGGSIIEHNLGMIEPKDKDKALYVRLFENPSVKVIVETLQIPTAVSQSNINTGDVSEESAVKEEEKIETVTVIPPLKTDLSLVWYILGLLVLISVIGAIVKNKK